MSAHSSSSSTKLPQHLLDEYSSGFAAGFLQTDAGIKQDAYTEINPLRTRVQDPNRPEHREDGYSYDPETDKVSYFDKDWINEQTIRHRLLTADPEYEFLSLVAGFSGLEPSELFDREALDEHAKRMLQRAAVADELGKSALTDLDRTQSLLEKFEKREGTLIDDLTALSRAQQDILHDKVNWRKVTLSVLTDIENASYPKNGAWPDDEFDVQFSFIARCLYPTEGLDSTQFADRFLSSLAAMAEDSRALYIASLEANTQDQNIINLATQNNPRMINLAAYVTFALYVSHTSSACRYIVLRMLQAKKFPPEGDYAKDASGDLYCADVKRLMELLEAGHTKHAVTMKSMSPLLYIHLKCMMRRWFGPKTKEEDDESDPCKKRPTLLKPDMNRKERKEVAIYLTDADADEDGDELFFRQEGTEGSALLQAQNSVYKTRGDDQYQDLMDILLSQLFRYGMATLVYDMSRLRAMLCRSSQTIENSILCEDADEKLRTLRRAQPVDRSVDAIATLSYFFGGMSLKDTGLKPVHRWANERDLQVRATAYYFIYATLGLYEKATKHFDGGQLVEREWFQNFEFRTPDQIDRMYTYHVQQFVNFMQCPNKSREMHIKQRTLASYQASGAIDVLLDIIRTYTTIRPLHTKFVVLGATVFPTENENQRDRSPLPVYVSDAAEKVLLNPSKYKAEEETVAIRELFDVVENKRRDVTNELDVANVQISSTVGDMRAEISRLNADLVDTEKNVMSRIKKRYPAADIDGNSGAQVVKRLKQVLSETYVPSGNWAMMPENTGVVLLSAVYRAAVAEAYTKVQRFVPNLMQASLDDLKRNDLTQVDFAKLVASYISQIAVDNPKTLTLNRVPDDLRKRQADIFRRLQELPALQSTGLGTPGGWQQGRSSAGTAPNDPANFYPPRAPFHWVINPGAFRQPSRSLALDLLPKNEFGQTYIPRNDFVMEASRKRPADITTSKITDSNKKQKTSSTDDEKRKLLQQELEKCKKEKEQVRQQLVDSIKKVNKEINEMTQRAEKAERDLEDLRQQRQQPQNQRAQLDATRQRLRELARKTANDQRRLQELRQANLGDAATFKAIADEQEKILKDLNEDYELEEEEVQRLQNILNSLRAVSENLENSGIPNVINRATNDATLLHWKSSMVSTKSLMHGVARRIDEIEERISAAREKINK